MAYRWDLSRVQSVRQGPDWSVSHLVRTPGVREALGPNRPPRRAVAVSQLRPTGRAAQCRVEVPLSRARQGSQKKKKNKGKKQWATVRRQINNKKKKARCRLTHTTLTFRLSASLVCMLHHMTCARPGRSPSGHRREGKEERAQTDTETGDAPAVPVESTQQWPRPLLLLQQLKPFTSFPCSLSPPGAPRYRSLPTFSPGRYAGRGAQHHPLYRERPVGPGMWPHEVSCTR